MRILSILTIANLRTALTVNPEGKISIDVFPVRAGIRIFSLIGVRSRNSSRLGFVLLLSLAFITNFANLGQAEGWRQFDTKTFSVTYPGNWFLRGRAEDYLDLLDTKNGGETGSVVADKHVAITVLLEQKYNGATPDEVSASFLKEAHEILVRDRPISIQTWTGGCMRVREDHVTFSDYTPSDARSKKPPFKEAIGFFCETPSHNVVGVHVLWWEGDTRRATYRAIGLRMVKSLKLH